MPIITFSIVFVIVIIMLIASFILFRKDQIEAAKAPKQPATKKYKKSLEDSTIDEIAARISTEKISEKELLKVVALVAEKHKFPRKNSDKDNSAHLKFVSEFCLNENADGATIVKMSNTLKAINTSYKKDIEAAERAAIRKRDGK